MAAEGPRIPIARPLIDEIAALAAVSRVLASGWVTQGPEVAAFEQEFAAAVGCPHACAVSSGTAALHLALRAVGVGPGDEVVTVSHSFIASANAIRYCGAIPVFVDIEAGTFNMDVSRVAAAISGRTRAILCVHQLGMPCDLRGLIEIARRHDLRLIEDAACAIGSEISWNGGWQRVGRPHGDIACFSLHPRKLVTTGEGGMITTASAAWDAKCRRWRHHGMSVSDAARHHADLVIVESYPEVGFNYRLTDVQAAIGRAHLIHLDLMVARRRALADAYRLLLADIPGLKLPEGPTYARSNWQSYCVYLPDGCDQGAVMRTLLERGIATRPGVMCAHLEAAYPPGTWRSASTLVHSEAARAHGLILPLYHDLTHDQQRTVADALRSACRA